MIGFAQRAQEDAVSGQAECSARAPRPAPAEAASARRRRPGCRPKSCTASSRCVGFYLSAHPLDEYKAVLAKMRVQNLAEFSAAVKQGATAGRLAGTVTSKQERKTRTGNKMGIVQFSDSSGQYRGGAVFGGAGAVSRPAGAGQIRGA